MMKSILVLLLAVVICVYGEEEVATPAEVESDVLVLTQDNFKSTIESHPIIAVEFYAPWCGHCKNLAPHWEKAATATKGKVGVAKVDCTTEKEICEEFGVRGYPTLKIFREGVPAALEVGRTSDSIITFLNKELEPPVTKVETEKQLEEYLSTHPIALVLYISDFNGEHFSVYEKAAKANKHIVSFVAVKASSSHPDGSLVLKRNFDEPEVVYTGKEITEEKVKPWLLRHLVPLLGEISGENFQSYMNVGLPIGYLFLNPASDNSAILDGLKAAVNKIKDFAVITWINNAKYGKQAEKLGLSGKHIPALVIDGSSGKYVYPEADEFSIEKVSEWLHQVSEGKVEQHIKSEEIPENNEGPVKVVVRKSFDDIVLDSSKDVLVEFYAPWCGHCKTLAPIYEELGSSFKDVPSVVIAKIDATANDVNPTYNIKGFPTIMFFPANAKQTPLTYEGSRTLEGLSTYVRENVHHAIPSSSSSSSEEKDDDDKSEL